jgi:hypothetical protein
MRHVQGTGAKRSFVGHPEEAAVLLLLRAFGQPTLSISIIAGLFHQRVYAQHHRLLHQALQKEEARAIVIEMEEELETLAEDEEFYAANFEFLDQDDTEEEEGMEPDREVHSPADPEQDRPCLCQQRVPLEVNGILTSLHTLYDWESATTLVRKESARRIGLQAVRPPRRVVKGHKGEVLITHSNYYLPFLDVEGNIQVICAHGVDVITTVTRTRLPHVAREISPVIRVFIPWMETGAGPVELLIGLDNRQWLPIHIEDSWDPDDNMRLMKWAFGHRFMITDGWGRSLLPPEMPADDQEGALGGQASGAEETQAVLLEEYQGWSQGMWSRDGWGAQRAPAGRGWGQSAVGRGRAAVRRPSPRGREESLRMGRGVPEDSNRAGEDTLPQSECHTTPLMLRAIQTVAGIGQAGVQLSGLSNCEGAMSRSSGNARSTPAARASGHRAALGSHDGRHGAGYATGA